MIWYNIYIYIFWIRIYFSKWVLCKTEVLQERSTDVWFVESCCCNFLWRSTCHILGPATTLKNCACFLFTCFFCLTSSMWELVWHRHINAIDWKKHFIKIDRMNIYQSTKIMPKSSNLAQRFHLSSNNPSLCLAWNSLVLRTSLPVECLGADMDGQCPILFLLEYRSMSWTQVVGYALAVGNYPWQSTAGGIGRRNEEVHGQPIQSTFFLCFLLRKWPGNKHNLPALYGITLFQLRISTSKPGCKAFDYVKKNGFLRFLQKQGTKMGWIGSSRWAQYIRDPGWSWRIDIHATFFDI